MPTDTSAEFTWTNPTQTITPTETQIRMLNPASLWATIGYPATGIVWGGLEPSTGYEFQVRLIRTVDGTITHFSPVRSIMFTTDPTTVPDIIDVGDDGDTDVEFPPPDPGCTLEWKLESSVDGTTWVSVTTGTDSSEPWEVTIPDVVYDGSKLYRVCSREVCAGVPGAWSCSKLYTGLCSDPPALTGAPFDDADLRFYLPGICPPDVIVEAISEEPATRGFQFDDFVIDGDGNVVLVSVLDGIVAYGLNPHTDFVAGLDGLTDDATLAAKVLVTHQPDAPVILFGAAGLTVEAIASGAVWKVHAKCHEEGAGITTLTPGSTLAFGGWYDVAVTHDTAAGDLRLYVDGAEIGSVLGSVGVRHNPGYYQAGVPEASLITNCAVWARVLADSELPGFVGTPPTVDIDLEVGQSDPTTDSAIQFTATFSEAVTGFATGDVTLAGTAGATTVTVLGSGAVYTLTVTGMTTAGTVVVSIAANVCTSVATSLGNAASTHTDNSVAWSAPWLPTSATGLYVWFDAADAASITHSSGAVSQWSDKSGNSRHVTQSNASEKPTTGTTTQNGLNVLAFDGGDWLGAAITTIGLLANARTVIVVWYDTGTNNTVIGEGRSSNDNGIWQISQNGQNVRAYMENDAGTTFWDLSTGNPTTTPRRITYLRDGTATLDAYLRDDNGGAVSDTGNTIGSFNPDRHTIGALRRTTTVAHITGWVAEIFAYTGKLTGTDLSNAENYADTKWGI